MALPKKRLMEGKENRPPQPGRVVSGYAAEEIVSVAEEVGADLIVLGTHGRKGIDKILFGSVAEKVIKTATVPVLSMRPEIGGD